MSIKRTNHSFWIDPFRRTKNRVNSKEFIIFNQEFVTLLAAGIPIPQALDILTRRAENTNLNTMLHDVQRRVRAGSSISEAFEAQGSLISNVYIASLKAGEKSGDLERVIRRYIKHTKIINLVRKKTASALVYPAVLMGLCSVVVGIMVFRVVPRFADFYQSLGSRLPFMTQVVINFSTALRTYLPIMFSVVVLAVIGAWLWNRYYGIGFRTDQLLLKLPGLGAVVCNFSTSQFTRTLATLIGGGIPVVSALDMSIPVTGNGYLAQQLKKVGENVRGGQSLSTAMANRNTFPNVAVRMIEVGESTGALQEMLNSVSDFLDEEVETSLGRFIILIEPILLIVMGVIVAILLLALYIPLFQLSSAV